jgi:hypothetical protein
MFKKLVMLLVLLAALLVPAAAQEEISCTPEEWITSVRALSDAMLPNIDSIASQEDGLLMLLIIEAAIDTVRATCTGGAFTDVDYTNGIIGPIIFSGTLYQATLTTPEQGGSVSGTAIEGDCGFMTFISTPFEGGEETSLFTFGGDCVMIFEVNVEGPWTLTIERLG